MLRLFKEIIPIILLDNWFEYPGKFYFPLLLICILFFYSNKYLTFSTFSRILLTDGGGGVSSKVVRFEMTGMSEQGVEVGPIHRLALIIFWAP